MEFQQINNFLNIKFKKSKTKYLYFILLIIVMSIFITIYLPIYLIYRFFFFKKKILKRNLNSDKELKEPKNIIEKEKRKYDLVLFGITGFTGRLCYEYLIDKYPNLNFAVQGRNKTKIKNILDQYKIQKDILICDVGEYDELENIIKNTKVVISTVGPFYQYGSPIVNVCSAYGTDYCDITGETYFLNENIAKYDNLANKTGARIVSFCGLDCLPYDLTTFKINNLIKENDKNDSLKIIKQYNFMNGNISGGTINTIINSLENKIDRVSYKNKNPLQKLIGKDDFSNNKCKNNILKTIKYSNDINKYCTVSPLAFANQKIVERSNNILNYNKFLIYEDFMVQISLFNAINSFLSIILAFFILSFSAVKNFFYKLNIIPKSGESLKNKTNGFYDLITIGESVKGKKITTGWKFIKDPGYIETSKMLVESGLTFVFDNDKISQIGGIHTTASCFGEVIFNRLKNIDGHQFVVLNNN